MDRKTQLWRWLLIAAAVLSLFAQAGSAAPQPATTTKTSKRTTSTKPTTTKTSTTKTSTTKTSTTKSSTTKTSTTKATTYTWKLVPSRSACPTYVPTQTLAARTFTAQGTVATQFVELNSGHVGKQLGYHDDLGDTVLLKTFNDSQIQLFKPNHYLMIVDNSGILVYDDKCQQGSSLRIPNFFNTTGTPSSPSTAEISPREQHSPAAKLLPRGQRALEVDFRFIDQCGYRMYENVTGGVAKFVSPDFPSTVYRDVDPYPLYRPHVNDTRTIFIAEVANIPNIDPKICKADADTIVNWFTQGVIANVLDGSALVSGGQLVGRPVAADSTITSFWTKIGIGQAVPVLGGALTAATAIHQLFKQTDSTTLLCTSLQPNFRYELDITTQSFGAFQLDTQNSPFQNARTNVVQLPTKVHDPCPTTYPTSAAWDATCQHPRQTPDPAAASCPTNPQYYAPHHYCGMSEGSDCGCGFNVDGSPMCIENQSTFFCGSMQPCKSNADCPCDTQCLSSLNPCGFALCAPIYKCRFKSLEESYEYYDYYDAERR